MSAQVDMNNVRYEELRHMLEERRREILGEVQGRMRDVRPPLDVRSPP